MNARRTLFALALALLPASLAAQVGSTTDILTGRITGPDSTPLAGAQVTATATETGLTRTATTDAHGRYTILFPDGGGQYRLVVRYLGMVPAQTLVQRQADEDRLITNVAMSTTVATLSTVTVRGRRPVVGRRGEEPGGTGQSLPPGLVNRLPIDASDLNALATLAPGVVGVAATDSTSAAFSVAGQPIDQNQITLDGLSFGAGSVPQEAIRSTRIITSTYDVARGQFTGGQVAATTRSGTNVFQGAGLYALRSRSLEFGVPATTFSQANTQNTFGGGFGGPLIKDKLFAFGAFQGVLNSADVPSLATASTPTLERLGVSADSANRFLGITRGFGVPPFAPGEPDDHATSNGSALVRVDYDLSETQTLTLRGDWQGSLQHATRIFPLAMPSSGGNLTSSGGGGMLSLTSLFGSYINDFRGYVSANAQHTDPYLAIPDARVVVRSAMDDGSNAVATLQFGGSPSLPQATRTGLVEVTDEVSWLSPDGAHRIKLGALFNRDQSTSTLRVNSDGTFTFNSLADLENDRPISFTRTLSAPNRHAATDNGAIYLGDTWRAAPTLEITAGTRVEGSRHPGAPAYNAQIDSAFGLRTDRFPSEVQVTPRIGFTYFVRSAEGLFPTTTLRGGFGEFRGKALSNLFANAANANGLANGTSQIVCFGPATPTPDWAAYLDDPASIPTQCAGPDSAISQRPNVTVIDPHFAAPRVWRGSLGASHRFFQRYTLSLDLGYARGVSQTGTRDLNLTTTPQFTLANEGGRPVYVPAAAIFPENGALSMNDSRRDAQFGHVNDVTSILHSETEQATLSLNTLGFFGGLMLNAAYTYTHARDQQLGFSTGFAGGTTAGNPNVPEWGTSDLERRHNIVLTMTYPITPAIELAAIGHLISGPHYTPMVGTDINGDGLANDRAFIFNPAAVSDTAVANGMARLLATAPARVRDCLDQQLGQIAARNSCTSPWQSSLDMQMNIKPATLGLDRRLTLSIQALNTLAGLDQLLHGSNHLHGWGEPSFPDRTLLYVRGFDPQSRQFLYTVNGHFGASTGTQSPFRVPFQLAIQARLTMGPDPARQNMRAVFARSNNGKPPTVEDFKTRLARAVPNPFDAILAIKDSIKLDLTTDQVARLHALSDSLHIRSDSVIDTLATLLETLSTSKNPDPQMFGRQLRPKLQAARALAAQAIKQAQSVLTPAQWKKVPDRIKNPFQTRMGGPGGGVRMRTGGPPDEVE